MMVGAFLYLPDRYQGASVSKVRLGGLNGRQQKGELGSPRI